MEIAKGTFPRSPESYIRDFLRNYDELPKWAQPNFIANGDYIVGLLVAGVGFEPTTFRL